jgi:NAD(P)-dependent dehydrogenase (short-subunit alcohol dehydrogenase family)
VQVVSPIVTAQTDEKPVPLLIGSDIEGVRRLAEVLDAPFVALPPASPTGGWAWANELERWRETASAAPKADCIVVVAWARDLVVGPVAVVDSADWESRIEQPLARWMVALGCAVVRCRDGGSIVAVVEGPTPLECAGWAPETAVAEGVRALARSLALSEGARGVRVNTVSTPARFPFTEVVAPAPPLSTFPGRIEYEVAGAVRLLLNPDARGITGGILHADAGRAW